MFEKGLLFRGAAKPASPTDDFLRRHGKDADHELLDGVMVERMEVSLEHEKLRVWLEWLFSAYLNATQSGLLITTNTALVINERRVRRPDLMYLSDSCRELFRGNAVYGAPDLIIEIISAYDLGTDMTSRENDYRLLGVPEIVFLDPVKRQARLLRLRGREYESEMLLDAGTLQLAMMNGIQIPLRALMYEPRPPVEEMVQLFLAPPV